MIEVVGEKPCSGRCRFGPKGQTLSGREVGFRLLPAEHRKQLLGRSVERDMGGQSGGDLADYPDIDGVAQTLDRFPIDSEQRLVVLDVLCGYRL